MIISVVLFFMLVIQYAIWLSKVLTDNHESKLDFFTDLIPGVIYIKLFIGLCEYVKDLE
jgi:hypothetical protein